MILVSISSTEEKFVIRLKHKIDYVVEKKFGKIIFGNTRTFSVFVQLFLSSIKLIIKEAFVRSRR